MYKLKACIELFNTLKQNLITAPILVALDWERDSKVYVDASNVAIGAILSKKDEKWHDHPIYFASRQLIQVEHNYTINKRERLALGVFFLRPNLQTLHDGLLFFMLTMMP